MSELGVSERRLALRRLLASCIALSLLGLTGCAGGRGAGSAGDSAGAKHPLLGAPGPAFELRDVGGAGNQSLQAYSGKVVIVDFWATWCEPCRDSFPAYQKLVDELGGALAVIAVSQDDSEQGIEAFRSETGAKFPIVWDEGKQVAKGYDPPTMPTAFVLDKSGIVRFVHVGYRAGDERILEEEVRSLAR